MGKEQEKENKETNTKEEETKEENGTLNDAPFLAGHSTTIFSAKFY